MTDEEAFGVVNYMQEYFNYSMTDRVKMKYIEFLSHVPSRLKDKLENAIERECEFSPKIAKLNQIVQSLLSHNQADKPVNEAYCWYCANKGLIPYERKINGMNYKFAAYCSHCSKGMFYSSSGLRNADEVFGSGMSKVPIHTIRTCK